MRLLTKGILVLFVVALTVVVFFVLGTRETAPGAPGEGVRPTAPGTPETDEFDDPVSAFRRWQERLERMRDREEAVTRQPPETPPPPEIDTTAEDEGTVVARRSDEPVLGADPPGPVLHPDGIDGEVVTARWQPRREPERRTHTVREGDTLYAIAEEVYGSARYVSLIEQANPGLDPRALHVGRTLRLPEPEEAGGGPAPARTVRVYKVRRNDTLIGIARRFYGDAAMYLRIYEANRDRLRSPSATLYVGQTLRLPEPG